MLQNRGFASKKQPLPAASGLIVHIHGGGFVAQSPKSHEVRTHTSGTLMITKIVR